VPSPPRPKMSRPRMSQFRQFISRGCARAHHGAPSLPRPWQNEPTTLGDPWRPRRLGVPPFHPTIKICRTKPCAILSHPPKPATAHAAGKTNPPQCPTRRPWRLGGPPFRPRAKPTKQSHLPFWQSHARLLLCLPPTAYRLLPTAYCLPPACIPNLSAPTKPA
jgi:hypothetical protein